MVLDGINLNINYSGRIGDKRFGQESGSDHGIFGYIIWWGPPGMVGSKGHLLSQLVAGNKLFDKGLKFQDFICYCSGARP